MFASNSCFKNQPAPCEWKPCNKKTFPIHRTAPHTLQATPNFPLHHVSDVTTNSSSTTRLLTTFNCYVRHADTQNFLFRVAALFSIRLIMNWIKSGGFLFCVYRDALEFAHRQLFISEELDNPNMRAESYLNLARSHQRLGALERYVTLKIQLEKIDFSLLLF